MTAVEMASILRSLADEIEGRGVVEASAENWALDVRPMEILKVEVQYKHHPSRRELEFQVKLKENPRRSAEISSPKIISSSSSECRSDGNNQRHSYNLRFLRLRLRSGSACE